MEIKNAIIDSVYLGYEGHGIFTCNLNLVYGDCSRQGFGGYCLDIFKKRFKKRIGTAYGLEFIKKILEVVEVNTWEELEGKNIRVKADRTRVCAIGNYLKDKWFNPETDLEYIKNK